MNGFELANLLGTVPRANLVAITFLAQWHPLIQPINSNLRKQYLE